MSTIYVHASDAVYTAAVPDHALSWDRFQSAGPLASMGDTCDNQGYALGWQSGRTAEGNPASAYLQGQSSAQWECAAQYEQTACAAAAQAWDGCYQDAYGSFDGCYGSAYGNGYSNYGGYVSNYSQQNVAGYAQQNMYSHVAQSAYLLNLDQYSDASDSEDEDVPVGKAKPAATTLPGWAPKVGPPAEVAEDAQGKGPRRPAELAEPAPEPFDSGDRLMSKGALSRQCSGESSEALASEEIEVRVETPSTCSGGQRGRAGSEAEVSSAVSEPEAEASGQEQERTAARGPVAAWVPLRRAGGRVGASMAQGLAATLQVSESSWAAQQRARRSKREVAAGETPDDAEVLRRTKSILNKLTIEKFPVLFQKLVSCGIKTASHAKDLIHEVFEKATTQHHFVHMYADLCARLQEHFEKHPVTGDSNFSFKRLLLNECQASFERNLAPPSALERLEQEERTRMEFQYKTRMIGNIRFVGALLTRKMFACKVMFMIIEELLANATPEALEALAMLLMVVGPTFDAPGWAYYKLLCMSFEEVKAISQKNTCNPRARCLLKDLLDLRERGWRDTRPKRCEDPTTLEGVAQQAATEERETAKWARTQAMCGHEGQRPWQPQSPSWQHAAVPQQGRRFTPKT